MLQQLHVMLLHLPDTTDLTTQHAVSQTSSISGMSAMVQCTEPKQPSIQVCTNSNCLCYWQPTSMLVISQQQFYTMVTLI